MNKITKKLISGIAALSMLIPLYSAVHVSADDPSPLPVPNITRTLSVKFMGRGATPQETSPGAAKLNADDLQASNPNKQEFWVGVSVDKVNDLDLFKNGIYSLELAFEYDPSFIEPYYTSNQAETDWNKELIKGNLKAATDSDFSESAWWDSSKYEITSVFGSELDMETDSGAGVDREDADKVAARKAAGWKMCTVCVNYKPDVTFENARFNGLADDGEKFLLKLPFKVKKVPGDSDTNKNPKVLSLVRGPETLDIGSGANGKTPHSTWIKTVTDWTDQSNMKTLFKDSGDISLFGAGAVIEDIEPFRPETTADPSETPDPDVTPNPDATPAPTLKPLPDLSKTKDLLEEGFTEGTDTYFLSVPNEDDTIQFKITYPDTPDVKVHYTDDTTDKTVTVTTGDDGKILTDKISLKEINRDTANGGETDGYNNIITISGGGTDYVIHVRRLKKPQIILNPGNSPYGEIMKDTTITDKGVAKAAFDTSLTYAKAPTSKLYYTEAWKSYLTFDNGKAYNGDKDDSAIFIYQRKAFKDPGFELYDATGTLITDENVINNVNLSLTMKSFAGGVLTYTDDDKPVSNSVTATGNNYVFTEFSKLNIIPNVYTLNYSFKDPVSGETVTCKRQVIAISRPGDVKIDANNIVNNLDASEVKKNATAILKANSLYAFRLADAKSDGNKIINNLDASEIKKLAMTLPLYYNALPTE